MRLALLIFFLTIPLTASISHQIDTTAPLHCAFSLSHHNRILIESGRVKKVIFPEEKLFVRLEELSGQVFIQAKSPTQETTLISVITDDGQVQDLEVSFSERASQVVILQENQMTASQCSTPPYFQNTSLDSVIASILQGKTPNGFYSLPTKKSTWSPKRGVQAKLLGCLSNSHEDLYIYQITNTAWRSKTLCEKELSYPGVSWAFLDQHTLQAKEKTLAILSIPHEQQI